VKCVPEQGTNIPKATKMTGGNFSPLSVILRHSLCPPADGVEGLAACLQSTDTIGSKPSYGNLKDGSETSRCKKAVELLLYPSIAAATKMTDEFGPCETILVAVLRTVSIDSMNPIVADWNNAPWHFVVWKHVGSQQSRWTPVLKVVRSEADEGDDDGHLAALFHGILMGRDGQPWL
jgi:hypothetical protein